MENNESIEKQEKELISKIIEETVEEGERDREYKAPLLSYKY